VPLAVCWALLSDARAGEAARAAVEPLWSGRLPGWAAAADGNGSRSGNGSSNGNGSGTNGGRGGHAAAVTDPDGPWLRAARLGPADPLVAAASRECFAVAREALDRTGASRDIASAVDAFCDAYVSKDRCPADDLLEESS